MKENRNPERPRVPEMPPIHTDGFYKEPQELHLKREEEELKLKEREILALEKRNKLIESYLDRKIENEEFNSKLRERELELKEKQLDFKVRDII